MKRTSGTEKILFRIAAILVVVAALATVGATGWVSWNLLADLTKQIQPEPQVPHISTENVAKAAEILRQKESSEKIDLKTREVKFGKSEPFQ